MRKCRAGFTFIELLIAMLIFSIVSISIYLSFNVGICAWQKGEGSYRSRQEARYLLGMLSRELKNAVNSQVIVFSGSADSLSFCRAVNGLFRVTYEFDEGEKAVYRVLQTYKDNASGGPGVRSRLASGMSVIKFQYLYKKDGRPVWGDSWQEDYKEVPFGVKVLLTYTPDGSAEPLTVTRTVLIPTGILKDEEVIIP
ncbi:MAG: prepilin-type N-terminal cleavage/methylation domain-containing protein [Candidatus Omnitrophica bacterium]|nr:prepilin-type N-terminal cleavage/methylation domain-containing protein [Candidatus Omnitrophota bacterium]